MTPFKARACADAALALDVFEGSMLLILLLLLLMLL
jgi:hypothetical protein